MMSCEFDTGEVPAMQGHWIAGCEALASRVAALRADAANPEVDIGSIPELRHVSADLLVDIKASSARQTLAASNDFARLWQLWQDHYRQAFALARDHGVRRFGVCHDMAGGCGLAVEDWLVAVRVCSEAISAAVADVNARYGRGLVAEVKLPRLPAGQPSYRPSTTADLWGDAKVTQRLWDVPMPQLPSCSSSEQLDLFGGTLAFERAGVVGWAAD